jgi:hypothetical protein
LGASPHPRDGAGPSTSSFLQAAIQMDDSTETAVTEFLSDYVRRAPGISGFQRRLDPETNAIREFSLEFNEGGLLHRLAVVPVVVNGKPSIRAKYLVGPSERVVREDDQWRSDIKRQR